MVQGTQQHRLGVARHRIMAIFNGHAIDCADPGAAEGPILLRHAVQLKNVWIPYGE